MGCGASNNSVSDTPGNSNVVIAPTLPSSQRQKQEETTKPLVIEKMSAGNRL